MNINQENYEQYFLDYAEGALSPEMERELMLFLESHPDHKALLFAMNPMPSLSEAEPESRVLKNKLRKEVVATERIDEKNIDEFLVEELEGLLDEEEKHELEEFLSLNPAYQYDRKKYKQVILYPVHSLTFNRKENIKKRPALLFFKSAGWLTAAAAVLLLFFGIRFLFEAGNNKGTPSQFAGTPSHLEQDVTPSQSDTYQVPTGTPSQETVSQSVFQANVNRTPTHVIRMETRATTSITLETPVNDEILWKKNNPEKISFPFPEEKDKPLIAKVFINMANRAKEGIQRRQVSFDELDPPDFNFWSLANAGIKGYNSIADREVELFVHRGSDGNVSSYALVEQDRLLLEKNLGKN